MGPSPSTVTAIGLPIDSSIATPLNERLSTHWRNVENSFFRTATNKRTRALNMAWRMTEDRIHDENSKLAVAPMHEASIPP